VISRQLSTTCINPRRFFVGVALTLSLISGFAFSPSFAQDEGGGSSLADADNLLSANKYKAAEEAYRGLLSDDQTGDAYAGLAVALAKQSWPAKILEAEKVLRKAKGNFSDNPNLMAAAGYVSFIHAKTVASPAKREQYLEASESLCKKAIGSNSDILIAQQTLGLVKMAQDDVEAAIEPLRKATGIADNAVNQTLLAQALLKIDPKDKEAAELVDRAVKAEPNYHPAHLQKAIVLNSQGKHEDAFMELRNIPPNQRTHDWHLVEGDIYRKQGDGPAALASWRESIRVEPHSPDAYRHMAEYYAMRGDGELAIAGLHDALEIIPNDMPLRLQLAELALRQNKLDVAESEYRTVMAAQNDDPGALLGLSRVYFRKARQEGQYPPGFNQLMEQLQNVVTAQNVKGRLLNGVTSLQEQIELNEGEKALAQNRFKEARQHFQTVINNHRENPYDLLTLGEQAYYDGDLHSAEQAYTYAKEIPEVAPRAEQGISKIASQRNEAARQTKLGDATRTMVPEVAVDHYKQALIADPQSPNAYYGLYSVYSKNKKSIDPEQAVNYALCFLEAADDSHPFRKEVEDNLDKLKQRIDKDKGTSKR
jgi:tetratricopeptide (TPR) repeat protein